MIFRHLQKLSVCFNFNRLIRTARFSSPVNKPIFTVPAESYPSSCVTNCLQPKSLTVSRTSEPCFLRRTRTKDNNHTEDVKLKKIRSEILRTSQEKFEPNQESNEIFEAENNQKAPISDPSKTLLNVDNPLNQQRRYYSYKRRSPIAIVRSKKRSISPNKSKSRVFPPRRKIPGPAKDPEEPLVARSVSPEPPWVKERQGPQHTCYNDEVHFEHIKEVETKLVTKISEEEYLKSVSSPLQIQQEEEYYRKLLSNKENSKEVDPTNIRKDASNENYITVEYKKRISTMAENKAKKVILPEKSVKLAAKKDKGGTEIPAAIYQLEGQEEKSAVKLTPKKEKKHEKLIVIKPPKNFENKKKLKLLATPKNEEMKTEIPTKTSSIKENEEIYYDATDYDFNYCENVINELETKFNSERTPVNKEIEEKIKAADKEIYFYLKNSKPVTNKLDIDLVPQQLETKQDAKHPWEITSSDVNSKVCNKLNSKSKNFDPVNDHTSNLEKLEVKAEKGTAYNKQNLEKNKKTTTNNNYKLYEFKPKVKTEMTNSLHFEEFYPWTSYERNQKFANTHKTITAKSVKLHFEDCYPWKSSNKNQESSNKQKADTAKIKEKYDNTNNEYKAKKQFLELDSKKPLELEPKKSIGTLTVLLNPLKKSQAIQEDFNELRKIEKLCKDELLALQSNQILNHDTTPDNAFKLSHEDCKKANFSKYVEDNSKESPVRLFSNKPDDYNNQKNVQTTFNKDWSQIELEGKKTIEEIEKLKTSALHNKNRMLLDAQAKQLNSITDLKSKAVKHLEENYKHSTKDQLKIKKADISSMVDEKTSNTVSKPKVITTIIIQSRKSSQCSTAHKFLRSQERSTTNLEASNVQKSASFSTCDKNKCVKYERTKDDPFGRKKPDPYKRKQRKMCPRPKPIDLRINMKASDCDKCRSEKPDPCNPCKEKSTPSCCPKKKSTCEEDPCEEDPCEEDPCEKKSTSSCSSEKKSSPCKKKSKCKPDPCKKKSPCEPDPCKKKSPCKPDPCKKKSPCEPDPCKKKSPCEPDPCKKKSSCEQDPCKKKSPCEEDPCKKKSPCEPDPCKKKSPCEPDPCKKKSPCEPDPCKKKSPCKPDPCKKKSSCKPDPCKKKSTSSCAKPKKFNPCKGSGAPKKSSPCKKKSKSSCKQDPCKKKPESPCGKPKKCSPCKAPKKTAVKKGIKHCSKSTSPCKKSKKSTCTPPSSPCKKKPSSRCSPPKKSSCNPCKKKPSPCKRKPSSPCKKPAARPCKRKPSKCSRKSSTEDKFKQMCKGPDTKNKIVKELEDPCVLPKNKAKEKQNRNPCKAFKEASPCSKPKSACKKAKKPCKMKKAAKKKSCAKVLPKPTCEKPEIKKTEPKKTKPECCKKSAFGNSSGVSMRCSCKPSASKTSNNVSNRPSFAVYKPGPKNVCSVCCSRHAKSWLSKKMPCKISSSLELSIGKSNKVKLPSPKCDSASGAACCSGRRTKKKTKSIFVSAGNLLTCGKIIINRQIEFAECDPKTGEKIVKKGDKKIKGAVVLPPPSNCGKIPQIKATKKKFKCKTDACKKLDKKASTSSTSKKSFSTKSVCNCEAISMHKCETKTKTCAKCGKKAKTVCICETNKQKKSNSLSKCEYEECSFRCIPIETPSSDFSCQPCPPSPIPPIVSPCPPCPPQPIIPIPDVLTCTGKPKTCISDPNHYTREDVLRLETPYKPSKIYRVYNVQYRILGPKRIKDSFSQICRIKPGHKKCPEDDNNKIVCNDCTKCVDAPPIKPNVKYVEHIEEMIQTKQCHSQNAMKNIPSVALKVKPKKPRYLEILKRLQSKPTSPESGSPCNNKSPCKSKKNRCKRKRKSSMCDH